MILLLIIIYNYDFSVPLYMTERRIVNLLFVTILHPNSSPANVASAVVVYQDIASFLNITPKMLYIRYRQYFITVITLKYKFLYIQSLLQYLYEYFYS